MSRERDRNRKLMHRAHYEILAARFREELSIWVNQDGDPVGREAICAIAALEGLWNSLADRLAFDNEDFDREIFRKRSSPYEEYVIYDE